MSHTGALSAPNFAAFGSSDPEASRPTLSSVSVMAAVAIAGLTHLDNAWTSECQETDATRQELHDAFIAADNQEDFDAAKSALHAFEAEFNCNLAKHYGARRGRPEDLHQARH
jgi:hypothetical protein